MNARQKAKKLKKELDYIKSLPLREVYKVMDVPTEHLKAYSIFSIDEIEKYGEEVLENEARLYLSRDLMKIIGEKIIINKDMDRFRSMKYSTDIWVSFRK